MAEIEFERVNHLGVVTLNRPKALNALTLHMINELYHNLEVWADDPRIAAVVVKAAPGRAFCAGGDIRWLHHFSPGVNTEQMRFFWNEYRLNYTIHHYKKPYITLLDGITMGGGVGISLHSPYTVASQHFLFALPETGMGFFPDIGACHILAQCPGDFGHYLGLTGAMVGAGDAHALGLVKYLVNSENFNEMYEDLTRLDVAEDIHEQLHTILRRHALMLPPGQVMGFEPHINDVFQHPTMESIMAALAAGESSWHKETYHDLLKKSPLSLKVTLMQLQRAKSMNLAECLKMDYDLAEHFMVDPDFYEGVRAMVIDKDKSPQWNPSTLEDIPQDRVSAYFDRGRVELQLPNVVVA